MQRNAWNGNANRQARTSGGCTESPHFVDDHHFTKEELETVGELSKVCSQVVLKCLTLARVGRPDVLWCVNIVARAVTKWTRAFEKRLTRLIAYIHNASNFRQSSGRYSVCKYSQV